MRGRRCGPRGGRDQWERFAERWAEAEAGRGRGGRRMFDGGELRLVLLKLIGDEPRHGYDLIRAIEAMTGGAYAPSPGVVYPTLTLLDEMGLVEPRAADGAKKAYAITDAGRTHLAERAEQVAGLLARLRDLGAERGRADGAPVRRAMANLGMAIRHRMERGGLTTDTLHDVAELIDEVARKIERLR